MSRKGQFHNKVQTQIKINKDKKKKKNEKPKHLTYHKNRMSKVTMT